MAQATQVFRFERHADTLVVTPLMDLGELTFQELEDGTESIFDAFVDSDAINMVVDFKEIDYVGSTAMSFFTRLWVKARRRGGKLALCNCSEHQLDLLRITKLDTIWSVCETRDEAMAAVKRVDD